MNLRQGTVGIFIMQNIFSNPDSATVRHSQYCVKSFLCSVGEYSDHELTGWPGLGCKITEYEMDITH